MKYEQKTFWKYWKAMFSSARKRVLFRWGVAGSVLVLFIYIVVDIAIGSSQPEWSIFRSNNVIAFIVLMVIIALLSIFFSLKESSEEYNRQQALLNKLDGDPFKARVRVLPYPDQYPLNLQEAGIRIFNDEYDKNITNLRVELQNVGIISNDKNIGNVFPSDQHIILNSSGGVARPDKIISGQSEPILIARLESGHINFLFDGGAKPTLIAGLASGSEATEFELKMEIMGSVDDSRQIDHHPFRMRMRLTKPSAEYSWVNIYSMS